MKPKPQQQLPQPTETCPYTLKPCHAGTWRGKVNVPWCMTTAGMYACQNYTPGRRLENLDWLIDSQAIWELYDWPGFEEW